MNTDLNIIRYEAEIPLFNKFERALKAENYELCTEIQKEFKRRFEDHSFCEFAYLVLYRSEGEKYGLLDYADNEYSFIKEL